MVTAFIWTERPTNAQFGSTGLCRAGVLTAGIMNSGMFGLIMRRRSLILKWRNGLIAIILKSTLGNKISPDD
jgi:hypothetical protein